MIPNKIKWQRLAIGRGKKNAKEFSPEDSFQSVYSLFIFSADLFWLFTQRPAMSFIQVLGMFNCINYNINTSLSFVFSGVWTALAMLWEFHHEWIRVALKCVTDTTNTGGIKIKWNKTSLCAWISFTKWDLGLEEMQGALKAYANKRLNASVWLEFTAPGEALLLLWLGRFCRTWIPFVQSPLFSPFVRPD